LASKILHFPALGQQFSLMTSHH